MSRRWPVFCLTVVLFSNVQARAEALLTANPLENHKKLTSVEPKCRAAVGNEIVICGRREADRYRLPLVIPEAGDPAHETLDQATERLQAKRTACEQKSVFMVGCGMTGVSVGITPGRSGVRYRPLAP